MDEHEATAAKQLEVLVGPLAEALRRIMKMPPERADDLAQEALAHIWGLVRRGALDFSTVRNPRAYAYRWALHLGGNRWRSEDRRGKREQKSQRSDLCSDPTAAVAGRFDVRRALEQLPARQREVVYLHRCWDLPIDEIADMLGIQPGTVRAHLWRGMARLRELLDPSRGGNDDR